MRYVKGSITLSPGHDVPLLQQVLQCGFVTHDQLWQFMVYEMVERRGDAFRWRVKRLVEHGFLHRQLVPGKGHSFVYSLTEIGAAELAGFEHCCPGTTVFFERKQDHNRVLHALELNDIHLALCRSGALRRWMSEIEVRSRNKLTECGYAKEYDAILTLQRGEEELRVALEYERQAKGQSRYVEIAAAIEREERVHIVVYLFPDFDLLLFVRAFFEHLRLPIYFGICSEFKRDLLGTRLLNPQLEYRTLAHAPLPVTSPMTSHCPYGFGR